MEQPPIPNNLGPTLLLVLGLLTSPLLIGLPLVLMALARVRRASGEAAWPQLAGWRWSGWSGGKGLAPPIR